MTNLETSTAPIVADQEGDHYFMVGETVYYLNEFMKTLGNRDFDGVAHITNQGGIGIKVDEVNEEVEYTIFTASY
jgi:formylmethanofuran dehydrogenase subunit D|tara:strand:- start:438 stop:662 length:225 start_codon:yes stop_codon:yes gene_type:complete